MATTTRPARRTVRVRGSEVSTDRDALGGYAETLALVLAVVAFVVACWIVSAPGEGATLLRPDTDGPASRAGQLSRPSTVLSSTTDVLAPLPGDASSTSAPLASEAPAGNAGASDGAEAPSQVEAVAG